MVDLQMIRTFDPELYDAMAAELKRQQENLELIASENFVSPAVMMVAGSHLTNKYAEGYPGKRYYGGCQYVDVAETLAIERAKALFGGDYVNVQPHSGSSANFQVYFALLQPGDTVLGMNLNHGGHLTHGSPVNISGKYFHFISYGVNEAGYIDYDQVRSIALEQRPKMIVAGASAYPRAIDFAAFRRIADEVGAIFMVDMAHIAGLVAAGLHQNPVPFADVVTTTTHKTLRGPRGGMIIAKEAFGKQIAKAVFPGTQGGPLMHIIAAKALALKEAMTPEYKAYQTQIVKNAAVLADTLKRNQIKLFSDGTDNHLMLLDLRGSGYNGKQVETMLDEVHITTNKNAIPFDTASPMAPNGLRIGTPGVTTRGMKEAQMEGIGSCIADIIHNGQAAYESVLARVKDLTQRFPLYQNDFVL